MLQVEHVEGEKKGKIMLYALSTCGWCRKTKELLNELDVEYEYIYVDLLEYEDKDTAMDQVKKWNPKRSFPTLVIDDKCIVGFKEDGIREALA
jgi:glutaredoxin-like protein NrdH